MRWGLGEIGSHPLLCLNHVIVSFFSLWVTGKLPGLDFSPCIQLYLVLIVAVPRPRLKTDDPVLARRRI